MRRSDQLNSDNQILFWFLCSFLGFLGSLPPQCELSFPWESFPRNQSGLKMKFDNVENFQRYLNEYPGNPLCEIQANKVKTARTVHGTEEIALYQPQAVVGQTSSVKVVVGSQTQFILWN